MWPQGVAGGLRGSRVALGVTDGLMGFQIASGVLGGLVMGKPRRLTEFLRLQQSSLFIPGVPK
jgi:hypothetical protein